MKSRIAILGMLVTGMLFSTAGAGLALQDNAAVEQYATPTPTPTYVCTPTPPGSNVTPSENQGGDQCGESGVLPAEAENAPAPASDSGSGTLPATDSGAGTQPERQAAAAAEGSELPFTGFAAIPVLLGGIALLSGGLILRRRTREH